RSAARSWISWRCSPSATWLTSWSRIAPGRPPLRIPKRRGLSRNASSPLSTGEWRTRQMADDIKISELEEADEAWNFPLLEAIFNRRSRRFGWGMEIKEGPNKHKSSHPPMPLDELEEALLLGAATGISGMNLADMPHTPRPEKSDQLLTWDGMCNTMMEHVGRTWSSPC